MVSQTNIKKKTSEKLLALHQLPGQLLTDDDLESEHWYDAAPVWPDQASGGSRGTITQWSELAENALSSACRAYEKRTSTSSGDAMKRALGKEKTIGDKIAALTLLVKESPLHRLDELRSLLSFAQKKSRHERGPAIDAVTDLLLNDLLPSDRRLVFFQNRQFLCGKGKISKRHILYAMFESELKSIYREFLEVLEEGGKDTLTFFKQKVVKIIYELLVAKPENENALLAMLVNKLGDPDRKVSSAASHSLLQLIEKDHPQMRLVVVKEVERLLARSHVTPRTQYYSVCFLNQIRFTSADAELARKFVRVYMDLFTVYLQGNSTSAHESGESTKRKSKRRINKHKKSKKLQEAQHKTSLEAKGTKLMGAILVGINRAFPYTKPEEDDSCYDKYHDSLFEVAHAKSLDASTHALAFLFQISQRNSTQNDRFYRALYSRVYDVADASETTQAAFLNLLYRALKSDPSIKRVKAFMKRLLQSACHGTPGFAGACLMVVSEVFGTGKKGTLKSFVSLAEKDDQDEEFVDVDTDQMVQNVFSASEALQDDDKKTGVRRDSVSDMKENMNGIHHGQRSPFQVTTARGYDPNKRDPQYAGAERSSLWEAVTLTCHYHPSLSMFANTMCTDMKSMSYSSDPLKDFSQISFLDRFSYKKAKNRVAKSLYGKRSLRYRDSPMANSEEFQELIRTGGVAQDDLFLARFFSNNPHKVKHENKDGTAHGWHSSDADSEEEAFEEAMEAEMRRLGGGDHADGEGFVALAGDIDEADDDEIRAFEKAFENEMIESASEGHPETERDSFTGVNGSPRKTRERSNTDDVEVPSGGLFAPAEDYAEAIEMAISNAAGFNSLPRSKGKKKRKRIERFGSQHQSKSEIQLETTREHQNHENMQLPPVMGALPASSAKKSSKRRRVGKRRTKTVDSGNHGHVNNVTHRN